MNKERICKTLKKLCLLFGPSGCEDRVADAVLEETEGLYDECVRDSFGNVMLKISSGTDKAPIMLSAHMDEVGFMISDIDEYGYLHFQNVGGISSAVLPGRRVSVEGKKGLILHGVIASKAVHLQGADERKRPSTAESLVIDIGAKSRYEAKQYTDEGYYATFESEYVEFGENGEFIKSKALDDRFGCAVLIELMHNIREAEEKPERDMYFCFTVREELGLSGALVAANRIKPEYAIVLETTAVSDVAGTPPSLQVAKLGEGGCVLIADRSTIYDRELFDLALRTSKESGVKCQVKKYVSGGNDSAHIHKSSHGVRTLALSTPSRYLHSPSCVVNVNDLYSICELLGLILPKL
ncbi:MAG: M42 family metallopeptidase [Clostridia bacterium]|nr:M42 family metallopeptidase [Clostridia bacterium]